MYTVAARGRRWGECDFKHKTVLSSLRIERKKEKKMKRLIMTQVLFNRTGRGRKNDRCAINNNILGFYCCDDAARQEKMYVIVLLDPVLMTFQ